MKKLIISLFVLTLAMASSAFATVCYGDCPHEVPEFTTIGAGLALLGAAGYAVYRKRSRK